MGSRARCGQPALATLPRPRICFQSAALGPGMGVGMADGGGGLRDPPRLRLSPQHGHPQRGQRSPRHRVKEKGWEQRLADVRVLHQCPSAKPFLIQPSTPPSCPPPGARCQLTHPSPALCTAHTPLQLKSLSSGHVPGPTSGPCWPSVLGAEQKQVHFTNKVVRNTLFSYCHLLEPPSTKPVQVSGPACCGFVQKEGCSEGRPV